MSSVERPFHRRVLRNSVAGLAANIWAIAVALATLPLMVHGLGLANFGRWVLLQTMSASTGWLVVMDGGLAVAGTRLVSTRAATARHEATGSALGTTMATFGTIAVISAGICLAFAWPVLEALASHSTRRGRGSSCRRPPALPPGCRGVPATGRRSMPRGPPALGSESRGRRRPPSSVLRVDCSRRHERWLASDGGVGGRDGERIGCPARNGGPGRPAATTAVPFSR